MEGRGGLVKPTSKTRTLVAVLVVLAFVTGGLGVGPWPGIFLAAALAVFVGRVAYSAGYRNRRRDLIEPASGSQPPRAPVRATLPSWRRWLGVAAIVVAAESFHFVIFEAIGHNDGSGWALVLAVIASSATLGAGVWLMDRLWGPLHGSRERARPARRRNEDR
jgi:hypothetical protein